MVAKYKGITQGGLPMNGKQFVEKIIRDNQALFVASQMNVKQYFNDKPEEIVDHFIGRMVNERMNMVEISKQVANAPADADPVELQLLAKQAQDEAKHYKMVKDVIEHITGEELDVEKAIERERMLNTAKGASLLEKYGAQTDEAALAAYQLVAEGRAEAVWLEMSRVIDDDFISSRYGKISKDEGFHATIGARKLAKLATTIDVQERVSALVDKLRKDLFEISCKNTVEANGSRELVNTAYGW